MKKYLVLANYAAVVLDEPEDSSSTLRVVGEADNITEAKKLIRADFKQCAEEDCEYLNEDDDEECRAFYKETLRDYKKSLEFVKTPDLESTLMKEIEFAASEYEYSDYITSTKYFLVKLA